MHLHLREYKRMHLHLHECKRMHLHMHEYKVLWEHLQCHNLCHRFKRVKLPSSLLIPQIRASHDLVAVSTIPYCKSLSVDRVRRMIHDLLLRSRRCCCPSQGLFLHQNVTLCSSMHYSCMATRIVHTITHYVAIILQCCNLNATSIV
jgi:hypothetical protein